MRFVWRRLVVGSASAAVAASLLVVPTSVVSSSEVVETPASGGSQPGDTGAVVPAVDPSSTDVGPLRDKSKIFGETLMRLQVNMGKDDPVVRGKVLVRSIEGKLLLRGYTNAVGQVVFLTQQEMPDRVVVRVRGGQSKGLKGDSIDLRAFFEPRDGEVVDVNPLTTMDELCRSGNYGTYCSTAVDSFYRLKGSVDYRDLVAISSRWFDGSRFGRDAARRGLTTWQWAERVLLKAYAGKKTPKVKGQSGRSDVTARVSTGGSFVQAFVGGILTNLGGTFAEKAMISLGFIPPKGQVEEQLRTIRQELGQLSAGIASILEGQSRLTQRIDELEGALVSSSYRQLEATFESPPRRTTMNNVLRDIRFWMQFAECASDASKAGNCSTLASPAFPADATLSDLCSREAMRSASNDHARDSIAQCAVVTRSLRNFATLTQFTPGSVGMAVAGRSGSGNAGLIQVAQDAYARSALDGIVTGISQSRMIEAGLYWHGIWSQDLVLWAMALAEGEQVLSAPGAPSVNVIRESLREQSALWRTVLNDRTGRYFPEIISAGCRDAIFYDVRTGNAYARGLAHYFARKWAPHGTPPGFDILRTNQTVIQSPSGVAPREFVNRCNWVTNFPQSENIPANMKGLLPGWSPVPTSLVPRLDRVVRYLRDSHGPKSVTNPMRISIGEWRTITDGRSDNGCYELKFNDHFHNAAGSMVSCPYIDYEQVAAAELAKYNDSRLAMSCSSVASNSYVLVVPGYKKEWVRALDSRVNSYTRDPRWSCEAPDGRWNENQTINMFLFPGNNFNAWERDHWWDGITDRGPWKLAHHWCRTCNAGSGSAKDFLPSYLDRVPRGVGTGLITRSVPDQLLMRPAAVVPRV